MCRPTPPRPPTRTACCASSSPWPRGRMPLRCGSEDPPRDPTGRTAASAGRRRRRCMIEVVQGAPDEAEAARRVELPTALPVLPLRETVAFPNTVTPLAVGQERSVQLVNDVLGRDRMLVMVASTNPEV